LVVSIASDLLRGLKDFPPEGGASEGDSPLLTREEGTDS